MIVDGALTHTVVQPGDEIAASVRFENATEQGGGDATMYVYNFTDGQQFEQPFHELATRTYRAVSNR